MKLTANQKLVFDLFNLTFGKPNRTTNDRKEHYARTWSRNGHDVSLVLTTEFDERWQVSMTYHASTIESPIHYSIDSFVPRDVKRRLRAYCNAVQKSLERDIKRLDNHRLKLRYISKRIS